MLATSHVTFSAAERRPIYLDGDGLWIEPSADAIRRDPIRIAGSFTIEAETCNDQFLDRGLLLRWRSGSELYEWVMRRTEPKKDAARFGEVLSKHGLPVERAMSYLLRRFLLDVRPEARIVGLATTPKPVRMGAGA